MSLLKQLLLACCELHLHDWAYRWRCQLWVGSMTRQYCCSTRNCVSQSASWGRIWLHFLAKSLGIERHKDGLCCGRIQ